jgi:hypothetical protein
VKTVWAEFQVPDDATTDAVAEALEIVFRAPEETARVHGGARRAMETLRTVPPRGCTIADLRLSAADTVHLCYEYGRDVVSADPWTSAPDVLSRRVHLESDGRDDGCDAVLDVRFEPGTAIVLAAAASGDRLDGPGRRLDPLLVDSEEIARARLAASERVLSGMGPSAAPISPWYGTSEPGMVAIARDLLLDGAPTRLVVTFAPGSTRHSSTRREDPGSTAEAERP